MNLKVLLFVLLSSTVLMGQIGSQAFADSPAEPARKTLTAFSSEEELNRLFDQWKAEAERRQQDFRRERHSGALAQNKAEEKVAASGTVQPAEEEAVADSVTNNQTTGVDEGGIVKLHGKHLVVLRRGRLFTVKVDSLQPVDVVNAFAPGLSPSGAWYDEMLISGNTIAVIGYSYARGGTEVGLFDINSEGALRYRSTYHLRSNDYYASRNYASRLIGNKLIFYTPLYLSPYASDPYAFFPAYRRWNGEGSVSEFKRIAPATRIYRVDEELNPWDGLALHSVTVCDLAQPAGMSCEATAVMGPAGRVFYVSANSVYVWTSHRQHTIRGSQETARSAVFRIPLDGSAPQSIKASGSPIDQFSFLENDGYLNVLLRSEGRGEAMWSSEKRGGAHESMALLHLPLSAFGDGRQMAEKRYYHPLPRPSGFYVLQNRYVGDYLLYGADSGGQGARRGVELFAVRHAASDKVFTLPLTHGVERIEALGAHALVVGTQGRDLHFSSIRLSPGGAGASVTSRYVRADAAQGETRSHGFFYKSQDAENGLLGLPVLSGYSSNRGMAARESAAVLFLSSQNLKLGEIGALESQTNAATQDACQASCVDWYGNARPLFIGKRVIALMGYELVEGTVEGSGNSQRIREVRRTSFAPRERGVPH